ncbi:MAG: CRISPR-associated protein Cas4 [Pseudothermotoga sp.]|nr:CRISPR-associated protein Cas4 [Pseudothermotoga sp.]
MLSGSVLLSLTVCEREAWLIAHQIEPDQNNPFIEIGRLIHEESYKQKGIREVSLPGMKIDLIFEQDELLIVGEIKKSSKFLKGARIQLIYYLSELEKRGIRATGKILIPRERKQIQVILDNEAKFELERFVEIAEKVLQLQMPPRKNRTGFCRSCGYELMCWS